MQDLVDRVVLGAFARHTRALELPLSPGARVPAVGLQGAVVVVLGACAHQLQGVRHVSLHDLLAGRPVVEDGDVVPQCPAGAAGRGRGPLAQVTELRVGSNLQRETCGDRSLQTLHPEA